MPRIKSGHDDRMGRRTLYGASKSPKIRAHRVAGCQFPQKSLSCGHAENIRQSRRQTRRRQSPSPKGDHVFLVDGSGYIFRAYHALPPLNRKSDGLQVNAVLGFCNMLWKLLRDMPPDNRPTHLAIIFDKSEVTFRNKLYPDYKAHRPPAPDDLIPQFALIREAVRAFDLPCLEQGGFEADDLIATYAPRGRRARRHRDHRLLRQGPDAARHRQGRRCTTP